MTPVKQKHLIVPGLLLMLSFSLAVYGQEIDYDSLLQRIDTIENPVYKPVVSLSLGALNFHGEIRNTILTPVTGNPAAKLNVATFLDHRHYFVLNFGFLMGQLNGNQRNTSDLSQNLNFQTNLYSIGTNVEYRFGHFVPDDKLIRPYVFVGVESLNFSSKGDLKDANGRLYHYWSDGRIMDLPEGSEGTAVPLYRDYVYETDLRRWEDQEHGLGDYRQRAIGIPIGIGGHFRIGERAFFSLGLSYHLNFTDVLDNVAASGTSVQGRRGGDHYMFTHLTAHFDLFSDPATREVDLMFADAEFDPALFDDEDGDFVLDVSDRCPGTPYGVGVDSLGCPLDGDDDGVPDYIDQEPDTPQGSWVDDEGVTVTESDLQLALEPRANAMAREDLAAYMALLEEEYSRGRDLEIPEAYKALDTDGDGYFSFDELLQTIDRYFDYQIDLSLDQLREVNAFFFSQ